MIKRFHQSIEDPKRPLLGPNIWMLRNVGMILSDNVGAKVFAIMIHAIATLFVISEFFELYAIKSDLDDVITNLKVSLVSVICVIKSNTCVLWQKQWREVIDYVTEADKEERDDTDSIRASIVDSYTKYCWKITYRYWCLLCVTCLAMEMTPIIKYLSETYIDHVDVSERSRRFEHILSSWMPFDKTKSPGAWITVIWHSFILGYGAMTQMAFDVNAMVMMAFFGAKLELLRERCKLMLGSEGRMLSDEEAVKMFRKMHRTHVLIMKYSRLFNSLLSPIMFLYVVGWSVVLCASGFQLTTASSFIQRFLMAEFLIFGITQLFLFCWHGSDVLYKSQSVMLGPYESDWWAANVKQRRSILLLSGQLAKKVSFTAGPFTDLTLATFVTILKGSYSYYTLLRK